MREQLRASLTAGYPAEDPPRNRLLGLIMAALAVSAIALAIFKCRGLFHFRAYEFSHQAILFLKGGGFSSYLNEPPLYPMTMAPLVAAGLNGPVAGVVISLLAFGASSALCFWLTWRIGRSVRAALAASLIFMFLSLHLEFAAALNQESLYIVSCLAALLALDRWLGAIVSGHRATLGETVLLVLFVAAPFWVRYAGISIAGIGLVVCAGVAVLWPERRRQALTVAALSCVIAGVLFFRNQVYGGTVSGHPLGITPAENLFTASVKILYLTGLSWVQPVGLAVYGWWKVAMAFGIALLLLLLAWSLRSQPRALLALAFGLSQFAVIAIASSVTRIDELNPRFVLPAFGFLAIALGVFWSRQPSGSSCDSLDWQPLILGLLLFLCLQLAAKVISSFHWSDLRPVPDYPRIAGIGLRLGLIGALLVAAPSISGLFRRRSSTDGLRTQSIDRWRWLRPADFFNGARLQLLARAATVALACFVIVPSVASAMHPPRGDSGHWSPATIAWIRAHLPAGSAVLVNRHGMQLAAVTLDYRIHQVPFINPENGDYDRAYGARQWTRAELLRFAVDHEIRCLIFFLGSDRVDPLLGYGSYGDHVPRLLEGNAPEVADVVQTSDGTVVNLVPVEKLREIAGSLPDAAPARHE